jgi:glycosyltransferase involved in cell wall biosynthesis
VNVLLVSHCDFAGNSALHVYSVATQLAKRGFAPTVCVPANQDTVLAVGTPSFPVLTYHQVLAAARSNSPAFDLVHAWTPREHVRKLTLEVAALARCPYIVHLEDNERVLTGDEFPGLSYEDLRRLPAPVLDRLISPWRAHPLRDTPFLEGAAGMTVIVEALLAFRPAATPAVVLWPGFDEQIVDSRRDGWALRRKLAPSPDTVLVLYTGNIHQSNAREVESLYLAVLLLRRAGVPARLIKTGWNLASLESLEGLDLSDCVTDLGFVSRERVGELLAIADVLVQPGSPNDFNDYRFPSKLPDFLASGKPVILPRTNIGLHLRDGVEALLLDRGDPGEIVDKVLMLLREPALAARLGEAGRAFARTHLTWHANVGPVVDLYEEVAQSASKRPVISDGRPSSAPPEPPVKLLAFYLPQFHPIPENDEWWGEGFTEWANVLKARPLFDGHFHPQLPTELGLYDLRDSTVMEAQAALAREYGIYGFCFYYYWFNGRRVLDRPLNAFLERPLPEMPFCYCWANENWTRRWDGSDDEILLRQEYEGDWAHRFIVDLLPAFQDSRYVRVEGAPLVLVYRASEVPNPVEVTQIWRQVAREEAGLSLHLAAVQSFGISDPARYGFDAAVEFPPHTVHHRASRRSVRGLSRRFSGFLEDYVRVRDDQLAKTLPAYRWYRGVMPSWDNTARRGDAAHVVVNSSPAAYRLWLRKLVLQTVVRADAQEPLIFVNAWNEWAEGNHLEPDLRYGREWLEATRDALVDGLRQAFASRGLSLSRREATEYLRSTLPAI